jgi:hypothetical protein
MFTPVLHNRCFMLSWKKNNNHLIKSLWMQYHALDDAIEENKKLGWFRL